MAIADIYNSLTFGGVNSLDYGIYISGPGVFDAPTRAIQFVDVPGRNGAIEIDGGHWNNIEVTYKAGTFGDNQPDFASKINAFRNAIVSQIGYQRLTDTYNPDEYRLGIYASGLSVDAVNRNEAGEFDLVFNCKPQRYLLSGENAIIVSSGDTITNPTLYDAGPTLIILGNGTIRFNDYAIEINSTIYGDVEIFPSGSGGSLPITKEFNSSIANIHDRITLESLTRIFGFPSDAQFSREETTGSGFTFEKTFANRRIILTLQDMEFTVGTPKTIAYSVYYTAPYITGEQYVKLGVDYDGADTFTFKQDYSIIPFAVGVEWGEGILHSTKSIGLGIIIVDCEIGNAYTRESGQIIDLNSYISLGSDLPKLSPGENAVTFDSSITNLGVIPRWWEL